MKAQLTMAVVAALLLAVSVPSLRAQHPAGANAARYKIAVIDISYVFKEHNQFKQQIEAMKVKMETLDKQFKEQGKAIQDKEQARNQFKPNTQEWKNLDNEITQMKANITIRADQEQKSLMQEEANLYYQTYLEVQDTIEQYAKRHDLALVLRFNGDEVDPAMRQDIIRGINRPVVYQNSVDITPDILSLVNRSAAATPQQSTSGARVPSFPPPRQ